MMKLQASYFIFIAITRDAHFQMYVWGLIWFLQLLQYVILQVFSLAYIMVHY